jgi:hypothetical protein
MILHQVVFRWVDGVTDDDVRELADALTAMAAGIPELRAYRCGPNLHLRPNGADFGVVAFVDDEAGLTAYLDSAAHLDIFERLLKPKIAERSAVQLDVGELQL